MLQPTTPPPITTALAVFGRSMRADCTATFRRAAGGAPADEPEHGVDGVGRKIVRDPLADEESRQVRSIARGRHDRVERAGGEVDRDVRHMGRKRPEPPRYDLLLLGLGRGMVR